MRLSRPCAIDLGPLEAAESDVLEPGLDEVRIRVHACGICHTDLHVIEGELPPHKLPLTPGHQIVGVVDARGKGVSAHSVGARVGVPWLSSTCGTCEFCKRGTENLCVDARFTGYDVDGGYSEYVIARADFVCPIPAGFSDEAAAPLLCAGIIGFRALRLSGVEEGGRIGFFGFGASAHIAIQVARFRGCDVYVFSRSKDHRKFAERLGAVWTGTADEMPPQPLDGAISFAPAGDIVPKALGVLRRGGTLALAGVYVSPIPRLDYSLLYQERSIRSVANSTRQDAREFLKIAGEIPVQIETEVFSLKEANRALQLLKEGKIRGAGVLKVG